MAAISACRRSSYSNNTSASRNSPGSAATAACTAAARSARSSPPPSPVLLVSPSLRSSLSPSSVSLHSSSAIVGRRRHQRSRLRATFTAIVKIHGRTAAPARNCSRFCHTRTIVSCASSSASPALNTIRAITRFTGNSQRPIRTPIAASSPVCTRAISAASSAAARSARSSPPVTPCPSPVAFIKASPARSAPRHDRDPPPAAARSQGNGAPAPPASMPRRF